MAEEQKPYSLIRTEVIRTDIDYGVNPDDYAPGEEVEREDFYSATVTLVLRMVPWAQGEDYRYPIVEEINRKVEGFISGIEAVNEVTRHEYQAMLDERYGKPPALATD